MNYFHHKFCRSSLWSHLLRLHVLPWALEGVELGPDLLELGPGYGAATDLLRTRCERLTCLESDEPLARNLRQRMDGSNTTVLSGDACSIQLPDSMFGGVACFMMLHHVAPAIRQDQLFAEVFRVLRPGGAFAGADSLASPVLSVLHLFDTVLMVDPVSLPARLKAAGFENVQLDVSRYGFRFSACKPLQPNSSSTIHHQMARST